MGENTQANTSSASLMRPVLVSAVLFMLVCGLAYPLATTGVAQLIFPYQANGSLIENNGEVVGSELIAQQFTEPRYFHPRPSATEPPYNAASSAATNFGPTNQALIDQVEKRVEKYREANDLPADAPVPVDAVTASGSGFDPHISVANAEVQIPRVAQARNLPESAVRRLVEENTDGRLFGFIGEPGVNVLELNLALDRLEGE
ncbi:MAG: potassium-transporting ATPase subunit KdpC [Rubrobacter sp.]|nr:potassium-transporting ATPase subunit KdpC [Rubrobacter sp.]